ncbi:hypothetical protein [Rhizobium azibense]|uniref:hypothetical protein n=1 Tax=Rhizobium azibense TaxID=1136135 RepID=UPI001F28F2A3|nr:MULTISPECIES: hypothetical protein [Rhizobium]
MILEQGWHGFETVLAYKLEERGGYLCRIDPATPGRPVRPAEPWTGKVAKAKRLSTVANAACAPMPTKMAQSTSCVGTWRL